MGWASSFLHTSYLILYLGGVVRRKFRYRYLDVPSADLAFFFLVSSTGRFQVPPLRGIVRRKIRYFLGAVRFLFHIIDCIIG
jgi:hypothetical protein